VGWCFIILRVVSSPTRKPRCKGGNPGAVPPYIYGTYMVVIWWYGPTRAVVNTVRGGEGRCLDTFTNRIRSLHIDIVYPYISNMLSPHNPNQNLKMQKRTKPRKNQILFFTKILGIDIGYTYILNI
jgi:hypothetical protein